jgi:hypothetical protein
LLNYRLTSLSKKVLNQAPVWLLLILGMGLVVLRSMGLGFRRVPGGSRSSSLLLLRQPGITDIFHSKIHLHP